MRALVLRQDSFTSSACKGKEWTLKIGLNEDTYNILYLADAVCDPDPKKKDIQYTTNKHYGET